MPGTAVTVQTRLEARWRELQAAWAYLGEARAERRTAVERWRSTVKAAQEALELLLRENQPPDPVEHLRQCHCIFAKIENAKRSLESTRKRHDSIVSDCEAAFEAALMSDQLPLFGDADILAIGSVDVDGRRVKIDDELFVRGRGQAVVAGFRRVEGVEVVVLRNESGDTFEAIPAVLSRDPPEDGEDPPPRLVKRKSAIKVGDDVATAQGEPGRLIRTEDRNGTPWGLVAFDDPTEEDPRWMRLQDLEKLTRPRTHAIA